MNDLPEDDDPKMEAAFGKGLEPMKDTPIALPHGIAAIALNMALKYHDMGMIKDGALYQQYKLEGRNIGVLHLHHVFETAIKFELHLLGASERMAKLLIDALEVAVEDDKAPKDEDEAGPTSPRES